ncbi:MAG: TldD/PmbA family protein [Promethearchaeota archaeon]|nr:MAG: TldD/PmbA family protein [Candidatus Lokiarchaeota archaeon]
MEDSDIYSLAELCLKLVEKENSEIKYTDIYFEKSNYINIEIEENSIKNNEIGEDHGVSIRIINKNGALGFAYTNKLDRITIEKICKNAIKMMKIATPDPDFKKIPGPFNNYPKVQDLFDKNLKYLQVEDSLNFVNDMIKVCRDDDIAISQSGNFASGYSKIYIFNSNGLNISKKDTSCLISSNIIVKDKINNETSSGYERQIERSLNKLNAINVAKSALEDAKRNLNRKKIKNMKVPVILTPKGTISLILSPVAAAINAETFQYKRSFLVDKRGEKIGSEFLNIEDNGLINGAAGSQIFDDEGVPCKNKSILKNGEFLKTGLLHNSYTAGKEGVESTGNAARNSYISIPSIGITNFMMKPGDMTIDEMLKDIKTGVILNYTGDSPNISTGDFSGLILHGNLIKDGQIKESLNETMIGINLLDLFQKIDAVSKEYKVYGAFQAPYVKINSVNIIGGAN